MLLALQLLNLLAAGGGGGEDTTPEAFSFSDQSGVSTSSIITSAAITITGIDAAAAVTVTNGQYSIDGGAWTSSAGTVTNGQQIRVRHTSSGSYETAVDTILDVGGVTDTFTSTTEAEPVGGGAGGDIIFIRRRLRT
jgi:hypothetical protein